MIAADYSGILSHPYASETMETLNPINCRVCVNGLTAGGPPLPAPAAGRAAAR